MNNEPESSNPLTDSDLDELSLMETLDHVLNKGMVIAGEITISVANIDLVYLGLNVLLGSVDAIDQVLADRTPTRDDS